MRKRQTISVRVPGGRYPVWIEPGLLRQSAAVVQRLRPGCPWLFVVSSPRVWSLWGAELACGLKRAGVRCVPLLMDDREARKRLSTVEALAGKLLQLGADRCSLLAAFGGGVVGDVAGFLAASYMRGIDYLQIPTTVVGQVDSAIGGKTGVNLASGKNLLGAFHHPLGVLVDPSVLATLSRREFRAGLYEVIKYGAIGDRALFEFLEKELPAVQRRAPRALAFVLARSIRQKARVVGADEREQGLRQILNFGHTIGHALETLGGYRRLRHGEAVGWGMLAATRLAERCGEIPAPDAQRIRRLIHSLGPLPRPPRVSARRLYRQLFADKKKAGAALTFVLPRSIGRVRIRRDLPREQVLLVLRELLSASRA